PLTRANESGYCCSPPLLQSDSAPPARTGSHLPRLSFTDVPARPVPAAQRPVLRNALFFTAFTYDGL
ncbi:MAG: hypothetical protein ACLTLX_11630, partial [Ruthenibacterium lactatiformans]